MGNMSVQVENLEKNMAKLTVEVEAERLEKALDTAYNRQKKSISIPGFRKGKVPRVMVEKMYGPEIFYEDAANILLQEAYPVCNVLFLHIPFQILYADVFLK